MKEIESHLLKKDNINEAVVLVKTDKHNEKYLCAYIVLGGKNTREDSTIVSRGELREYLAAQLPRYMVPAKFITVDAIPLTPGGKVDRNALPEPGQTDQPGGGPQLPTTHIEETLLQIWEEVLDISPIGTTDSFFELGGHSLKVMEVRSRINQLLGVDITITQLFKSQTIKELAGYIKEVKPGKFVSLQEVEKKEYYILSSAQKRMYILQQMTVASTAYNMTEVHILPGEPDIVKLEYTFKKLINRHESLRTSFRMIADEPVQIIHDQEEVEFKIGSYNCNVETGVNVSNFIHPFDLFRAPLLRVDLIGAKDASQLRLLLVDMHHIISDGISHEILIQDFKVLYEDKYLPPLRIQYKDFSIWKSKQKEESKKQEAYWLKEYAGEVPVLNLLTDYPRPAEQSFEGDSLTFELESEKTEKLKALTLNEGVTLYIVLLSLFYVLLSKLSSQEDIVVGTIIDGRRHMDLERVMGKFVNTLAMRNYPVGTKTFIGFLKEVKERTLEAFENQDYPFEELVEQIAVNREINRNPLFEVGFTLQNMSVQSGTKPEVETLALRQQQYDYENNTRITYSSKLDMSMVGIETEPGLTFVFEYRTRLFKKETIHRFITYFKQITESILKDADQNLAEIEIMPPEEKNRLLVEFNRRESDFPKDNTINELFEKQVEKTPDGTALVGISHYAVSSKKKNLPLVHKTVQLTYRKLSQKSNQLARLLKEKGVQSNTIVGLMYERSIEMIISIMGVLKAGGTYLPIEPGIPQSRLNSMLKDCDVSIVLSESNMVKKYHFAGLQGLRSMKLEPTVTTRRPQILDFDAFPIPDRSVVDHEKYNHFIGQSMVKHCISIQATHGCPYNCAYCHKIWPKKHVVRSAENIFSEVKLYYDLGVRRFVFY